MLNLLDHLVGAVEAEHPTPGEGHLLVSNGSKPQPFLEYLCPDVATHHMESHPFQSFPFCKLKNDIQQLGSDSLTSVL